MVHATFKDRTPAARAAREIQMAVGGARRTLARLHRSAFSVLASRVACLVSGALSLSVPAVCAPPRAVTVTVPCRVRPCPAPG